MGEMRTRRRSFAGPSWRFFRFRPISTLPAICILGAGWLGRPLAQAFAAAGNPVRVTTTTAAKLPALTAAGLVAGPLALEPDIPVAALTDAIGPATVLVVTLPPGLRADPVGGAALYTARLTRLAESLASTAVQRVVLTSSTAVYPDVLGAPELTEAAADPAHPLVQAEHAFAAALPPRVGLVVARLAGLMGPGRAPGRFFGAGRAIPQPEAPVNMLHLTDAVGALMALVQTDEKRLTVNVCAAGHPLRRAFYTAAAHALQLAPPPFAAPDEPLVGKRISSARLRATTAYRFTFDDPIAALQAPEMGR
jgi:nucleoside-diphosphate-sugar epimerase